jgi:hypothetical protein
VRRWRYVRWLLAPGFVMLGAGLPLAGPAGPASASPLRPTATATPSPAQVAELRASDGASLNQFGYALAVTPDAGTALIGAPDRDGDRGAAYTFTRRRSPGPTVGRLPVALILAG